MDLFERTSNQDRFIFNVFFVTLLGVTFLSLIIFGIVLLWLRCRRSRRESNDPAQLPNYTASNFAASRHGATTDVVLGIYNGRSDQVYSEEIFSPESEGTAPLYGEVSTTQDDRARFYDANGWRGFAY